jgi:hypothetical protein
MSDTPETDATAIHDGEVVPVEFARKLERERDDLKKRLNGVLNALKEASK